MSDNPSGLIVVNRASMYNDDCFPEARVKEPRRAERLASSETSLCLSGADMRLWMTRAGTFVVASN